MKKELAKVYDFAATEQRLYRFWEENGYFKPNNDPHKPGFDPRLAVRHDVKAPFDRN